MGKFQIDWARYFLSSIRCREHPELMAILSPPHQTQPTKTQPISIESNSIAQKNTRKASKDAR